MTGLGSSFVRILRRPLIQVSFGLVVLLACTSTAQHWFVKSEVLGAIEAESKGWTKEVAKEIAYQDGWNLSGYRNAAINAPRWYVVTNGGLVIDIEGVISGMLPRAVPPVGLSFEHPVTVVTEVGEKWRLLAKKLDGGMIILGMANHPDDELVDAELMANGKKFARTVEQAASLSSREVNIEVDYAVITDNGEILTAWGGVPLHLVSSVSDRFKANSTTSVRLGSADFLVFAKPITDSSGKAVATILVPKDATLELRGIREQDMFNLAVVGAACVMAILMAGVLLRQAVSMVRKHPTLIEALGIGESDRIEFKRSLDWDFGRNARDAKVQLAVLKSIAAFLNSEGGVLLIGVRDDSSVEGIEFDLQHFNGSRDKFALHFRGILTEKIGLEFARYIKDRAEDVDGKIVWVVEVDRGPMEAFVKWEQSERFFIREGPRTLDLNPKRTVQYIRAKDWGR